MFCYVEGAYCVCVSVNNDKNRFLIKIVICHKIDFLFSLEKLQIRIIPWKMILFVGKTCMWKLISHNFLSFQEKHKIGIICTRIVFVWDHEIVK